jgi:hypothetical protein
MSILVDMSQVMISNLMVQLGNHKNAEVSEGMLRHMILNTLRKNRKKFHKKYGELVICADDRNSWRRTFFPYYKANRKINREESELDWDSIFESLSKIRQEIAENFPYKVLLIPEAEADDIIGAIVKHRKNPSEKILILSGDKDFVQLHKWGNVDQYNPVLDRFVEHEDPKQYLWEHILKGDSGDGIPNVLMPDSFFMTKNKGERQKQITKKRIVDFQTTEDDTIKKRINRNRKLIDLEETPESITSQIIEAYDTPLPKGKREIMKYLQTHKLRNLMENISEF